MTGGEELNQCGHCREVNDSSKSNVVTCIICKKGFHTSCVYLGGIKSANLPRVNWLCSYCAETVVEESTKKTDKLEELKAELRQLKELVLNGFAEMRGEVNSAVKKSSGDVSVCVEETVREVVTSAVTNARETMVTGESSAEVSEWNEVVKRGKKKRGKNLLIVKANNNEKAADKKSDIATALVGLPINDSRFTMGGNIIMNFNDESTRNEAAEKLKTIDNIHVTNVKKIMPKIMLCNVSKEEDKADLLNNLVERNECLKNIEGVKDKMKLLFDKPAAGGTVHYIIRCEPAVRASIHRHGDVLKVEWGRYHVRDRYQTLICFHCQRFGHVKAKCNDRIMGNRPSCPRCAGEHEMKECKADFKKCINCVRANKNGEAGHTVNEYCCPLVASELVKVKENTDHGYTQ